MYNGRDSYPGPEEGGLGRALLPVGVVAVLLLGFTLLTATVLPNGGGAIQVNNTAPTTTQTTSPPKGTFRVGAPSPVTPGDESASESTGESTSESTGESADTNQNQDQSTPTIVTPTTNAVLTVEPGTPSGLPAPEKIVWVDSQASDAGDGSSSAPFKTINEGVLAVQPGETMVVRGGTYREQVNPGFNAAKGTAEAPINVRNAPGEGVVILGRVVLTDADHWTISGINVTWDAERNDQSVEHMIIMNGGANWVWQDSEFWGARAFSAILVTGSPRNFTLRRLHVHDTFPTNDTNQDHLIYCNCGTGGGLIERNLLVGSANGRAVKVGGSNAGDPAVGNVVIRNNTMTGNLGPSSVQLSFNTSNVTVERNIMVSAQSYAHNVSTFELTGAGNQARDNIGWDSQGVVDPLVTDGGGNIYRDPRLQPGAGYNSYAPADEAARAYGHLATG